MADSDEGRRGEEGGGGISVNIGEGGNEEHEDERRREEGGEGEC